ncbi:MAG: MarC family protein [Candidatus Eiseniibacteriota bacterium]|jgi:small neutral amino acid transporter SnatA (MarC family)
MSDYVVSGSLMLALLNPFLVIIYLVDLIQALDQQRFQSVLLRAALIASGVFCSFAVIGDAVFSEIMHAEFASFQIFGGIIFVVIGLQFVFRGPDAIEILRGESEHIAGAVAMPVLIGPGTISASVIIGKRHEPLVACGIVVVAVLVSVLIIFVLKRVHDFVRPRNERLIQRYIEIAGRITALYVGTISIEMIMQGIRAWIAKL